ncbi:eukaryotic translation initiation factor 3 subunit G protein [Rutstroemia sp. NJR-2017a BVV2]|nr:eukaryotic translation initiation factor 3 subunit G protein [Rutstroemia sp. NJR-2017a BVV2]
MSRTTTNKDGTKTIVTWRINDEGKKVKTTRRIRFTTIKEIVNPRVAERKQWSKFGLSQKDAAGSSYVPPHLRNGGASGASGGDRMGGGKFERDDLATLRVTNVSEMAEEQELRDMFERFGRVTRVFLAKDRETGLAKGFAFISFQERTDAAKACEKMDGYGFKHLILRVEFAKKAS